jgi:hypothetical protein
MQDLHPSFMVKLGAMPQPILAAIALMAELHNLESEKAGDQSAGDSVDIEHIAKEHPYYRRRSTTRE